MAIINFFLACKIFATAGTNCLQFSVQETTSSNKGNKIGKVLEL